MSLSIPVSWLIAHTIGDFFLQTDWMATNKSKNMEALTIHVMIYSACFAWLGIEVVSWVFVTHWMTDYLTSRITSRLWFFRSDRCEPPCWEPVTEPLRVTILPSWRPSIGSYRHWFFVAVGVDQLIHFVALALIWRYVL